VSSAMNRSGQSSRASRYISLRRSTPRSMCCPVRMKLGDGVRFGATGSDRCPSIFFRREVRFPEASGALVALERRAGWSQQMWNDARIVVRNRVDVVHVHVVWIVHIFL